MYKFLSLKFITIFAKFTTKVLRIFVTIIFFLCVYSSGVYSKYYMISAANSHAVKAGFEILRDGGSAVDATIAAQMVLTLVEPQSSGIGGGAFLLNYLSSTNPDQNNSVIHAYDGRETAPSTVTENLFFDEDGQLIPWKIRSAGGKSVGVPGLLRMLEIAHRNHGTLPWYLLFQPAINLAEKGFAVSPRLHKMITRDRHLKSFSSSRKYFFSNTGDPWPIGHILRNPALAKTLRNISTEGPDVFYSGEISRDIVSAINNTKHLPANIKVVDLEKYKAKIRKPLCRPYRKWRVCGMPPPTSGGSTVLQILKLIERFNFPRIKPGSVRAVHLISEASRLAFADRNQYLADPDFIKIPLAALLDPAYVKLRSALISENKSMGKALPGKLFQNTAQKFSPDLSENRPISTSHISVIDEKGRAVSMTTSIGSAFGSRIMVRGFMLNNELTDFAARPRKNSYLKANRAGANKRPRSSMAPTIITNHLGKLEMVIGSPGGSSIIGYTTKAIIGALDWELSMQGAIALPNFVNKNRKTEIEKKTSLEKIITSLEALGHRVKIRNKTSGLHGIRVRPWGLEGGADPRREGLVLSSD